ncbi:MAG TPA: TIGR00725 family protein [Nitrospinota bacterium]|nr:TIGR00725 family protein [Nitrospinota bacterium]
MNIGVIGGAFCNSDIYRIAEDVGRFIAKRGGVLITGGLSGVMEAASKGAKEEGGLTVGILPGFEDTDANRYIDIPIVTGLDHARNVIVVRSSQAIIAINGEYGTLSEISIALKIGKPVIGINTWKWLKDIVVANGAEDAVEKAFSLIK